MGEVPQGVGVNVSPKEVSFQVGFTPSTSQIGVTPNIVTEQSILGFDQFTEVDILKAVQNVTTRLSTDPEFTEGDEIVNQ